MNKTNPKVDEFFNKAPQWQDEMAVLRKIVLECGLKEELKWRQPCYTFEDSNVVIISGFKDFCVLSFFKGALLKDPQKVLVKPGENTQSGRMIRFTAVDEIERQKPLLTAYIMEAVQVEKAGLKVDFKKTAEYDVPQELQQKLDTDAVFKKAFKALTPGRQRAYIIHFSQPKQSATRHSRIEKAVERIMAGKGFNDCVCGFSNKLPYCDGSHKFHQKEKK